MADISRNTTQHDVAVAAVTTSAAPTVVLPKRGRQSASHGPGTGTGGPAVGLTGDPLAQLEQEGCYGLAPGEATMVRLLLRPIRGRWKVIGQV